MSTSTTTTEETFTITHYIGERRVLERLEICAEFGIKVTDLQRLLANLSVPIFKAGNKYYYDFEELSTQIAEYRERSQKKAATVEELNNQRLAKRKAVPLEDANLRQLGIMKTQLEELAKPLKG